MSNNSKTFDGSSPTKLKNFAVLLLLFLPPDIVGILAYLGQYISIAFLGAIALAKGTHMPILAS